MSLEIALQILQTIGICVSALALVVIAIFAFTLWTTLFPMLPLEDEESEFYTNEEARGGKKSRRKW